MTKRSKKKQIEKAADAVAIPEVAVDVATAPIDEVSALLAARAAKWGFGTNVDAYNASREAQSKMRKADKLGDKAAFEHWRGIFRELNRDKKTKYGNANA